MKGDKAILDWQRMIARPIFDLLPIEPNDSNCLRIVKAIDLSNRNAVQFCRADDGFYTFLVQSSNGNGESYIVDIEPEKGLCQCGCVDWRKGSARTEEYINLRPVYWCKHGIAAYLLLENIYVDCRTSLRVQRASGYAKLNGANL